MRISDWSSDVCSSDLTEARRRFDGEPLFAVAVSRRAGPQHMPVANDCGRHARNATRLPLRVQYRIGNTAGARQAVFGGIGDRKRVVEGQSVSVSVDLGGGRRIKKTNKTKETYT